MLLHLLFEDSLNKFYFLHSTVLLDIYAADGRRHTLRALLDCGSQASFITEKSSCALMLRRYHLPINVTTFANISPIAIGGKCSIKIVPSGRQTPTLCFDVFVVPQITGPTPQTPVKSRDWGHINNLSLAGPSYHAPGSIDLLLGADILPRCILMVCIKVRLMTLLILYLVGFSRVQQILTIALLLRRCVYLSLNLSTPQSDSFGNLRK